MIATEKARIRTAYYLSDLEHTSAVNLTRGMPTIERTAIDYNLAHHDSFGYWESDSPDETYSLIPHGWTEEPFEPAEPYTDDELWDVEGNPTHITIGGIIRAEFDDESRRMIVDSIDGYPCEVDGYEQPETLPDDEPGDFARIVGSLTKRPALASEISDSIVLTGYAHCTFDEYPDLTPDDREDIRQDLALGLCMVAQRAVERGKNPRIRRDILRLTRDRLVARKRRESAALPCVAVANEHAAAEAREVLELERMARQANVWQMHLVEMERLQQRQPAMTGTRLL